MRPDHDARPRRDTGQSGLVSGSYTPRRTARHARSSRVPAVTILLLVAFVTMGVGLSFALAKEGGGPPSDIDLGGGAAVYAGEEPGRYTAAELVALAAPLPADAAEVHVPVLMYHYVDDEPPPAGPYADGLTVRTPDFEEELAYLVDNGYHTVTLAEVYLAMAGLRALPEKPVALTFDDGGSDNYTVAFPLLQEYGLTGTFFVITKTVGREGQMSWDQLREMEAAGMSVQSHSYSHPDLTGVSDDRLQSELTRSRNAIMEAVGGPGYAFCYPSGAYDARVVEAVRDAGYVMAVVTDKGRVLAPAGVFEIRRGRVQAFLPLESFAKLVD